jgi:hypothetical protein
VTDGAVELGLKEELDLMEDFVYLFLIVCAVAIVVTLVVAGFVIAATVATICVFGAATHAFVMAMTRGVLYRGGSAAAAGPDEPSFRAYYRGQVWRDLKLAIKASWASATRETGKIRGLVPADWDSSLRWITGAALALYAYVGLAIGAVLAVAVGILPALLIALFAAVAWALSAPLRALERLRRRRTGAYFDCQECHDRFPLPAYVCPSCGSRHRQLAPGPFGVLRHRCTCGARLPAVQFRGRERLVSECPQGHALGEGVGVVRTFHVPVAGGPSTGKSTFLAAAMLELEEAAANGILATSVQSTSRQAYDRALDAFRQGVPAPKTDGLPPAVVAEVSGASNSALLYAYDVAGEVYGTEEELRRDPAHGLAQGVVLLVDPFALDRVRTQLSAEMEQLPGLNPSAESPQRMLERLIGVLEEQGADLSRVSAAVCVTKTDALGIEQAIASTPGADDHARTRAWLEQEGSGNFLRAAEGVFRDVRCFGVSALGRTPGNGTGPFEPKGVSAPLLWLLRQAGIEPAAAGAALPTTTEKLTAGPPLDVTPRRPLFTGAVDAVAPLGSARYLGIGLVATALLALVTVPFAGPGGSRASSPDAGLGPVSSLDPGEESAEPEPAAPPAEPEEAPAAPSAEEERASEVAGALRRHYALLRDGEFLAAYRVMTPAYRQANRNWVSERSAAQPYVKIVELGPAQFGGPAVASVHVKFYGRDSNDTQRSDTKCRRFEGDAKMVRQSGLWLYAPHKGSYSSTEVSSTLPVCQP